MQKYIQVRVDHEVHNFVADDVREEIARLIRKALRDTPLARSVVDVVGIQAAQVLATDLERQCQEACQEWVENFNDEYVTEAVRRAVGSSGIRGRIRKEVGSAIRQVTVNIRARCLESVLDAMKLELENGTN